MEQLVYVSIYDIDPASPNYRGEVKPADISDEFKKSIRAAGAVETPLVLRKHPDTTSKYAYQRITGGRRHAACVALVEEDKQAGTVESPFVTVPAIVREFDDELQVLAAQFRENEDRQGVPLLRRALSYKNAIDAKGITQQELAELLNRDRTEISKYLTIAEADSYIHRLLEQFPLNSEDAVSLARGFKTLPTKTREQTLRKLASQRVNGQMTAKELRKALRSPGCETQTTQAHEPFSVSISNGQLRINLRINELNEPAAPSKDLFLRELESTFAKLQEVAPPVVQLFRLAAAKQPMCDVAPHGIVDGNEEGALMEEAIA